MTLATARGVVPRRAAAAVLLALVGLSLAASLPLGAALAVSALAALVVMPAVRRPGAWLPDLLAWLPIGVATALSVGVVVVIGSGLLRMPLWGGWTGVVTTVLLAAGLAAAAWMRGGVIGLWSPASALAWLPAVAVAAAAVFRFTQPMAYWSRPTWAVTDWMSHTEMVADLVRNQYLDYEAASSSAGWGRTVYPRGLHAVLAWLTADGVDGTALSQWEGAIAAVLAASTALGTVTLVAAVLMAGTVAARLGVSSWLIGTAAFVTALLMLHPLVYQPLTASGFLTTTAACLLLSAAALVCADGRSGQVASGRVVLMAVLTVGVFHVWQLLALPLAALTAFLLLRWWRGDHDRPWLVGVIAGLGVLACLPLALATLGIRRIASEALDGGFGGDPGVPAVVVSIVALVVLVWGRRRLGGLGTALRVLLPALLLLGVAMIPLNGGSIVDLPYYAAKLLWHAGVLALPAAVAGLVVATATLALAAGTRLGGSPVLRGVLVAAPIVLVLAYVGGTASYGIGVTIRTLAAPGGPSPQVPLVVLGDAEVLAEPSRPVLAYSLHPQGWQPSFMYTDWHAVQLARFLGAEVPDEGVLSGHRAGAVCAWLREHPEAIRLTGPTLGYRELLEDGCPEEVVRSAEWRVLETPAEWWAGTPWAETGGRAKIPTG